MTPDTAPTSTPAPGQGRARLHAVVPQLQAAELRRQLRAAEADERFTVEVRDSWDGPELLLDCPAVPEAARAIELLLRTGELPSLAGEPAPAGPRPPAIRSAPLRVCSCEPSADAFAAWERLAVRHQPRSCADYVFELSGPPALPDGWLMRAWSNPALGRIQFSVRPGPRLTVSSPGFATAEELAALLAEWVALLAAN